MDGDVDKLVVIGELEGREILRIVGWFSVTGPSRKRENARNMTGGKGGHRERWMLGEGTESRIFIPEGLPHGCGSMHHTVQCMSEKRGLEYV